MKINNKLKELNVFGLANQELYTAIRNNILDMEVNTNIYSRIARPKLAYNRHSIWDLPVTIDC